MYQTKHDQCVSLPPDTPLAVSISIIHRLHAIYLNRVLKQINLTAGQVPFLFQIAHSPHHPDEIAATAHIDRDRRPHRKSSKMGVLSLAPPTPWTAAGTTSALQRGVKRPYPSSPRPIGRGRT